MDDELTNRALADIDRVPAVRPDYDGTGAIIEIVTAFKACVLRWSVAGSPHRQMVESLKIEAPWSKLEQHARGLMNTFRRDVEAGQIVLADPPHAGSATMATRIFISHASADAVLASALITLLEAGMEIPTGTIRCTSVDGYGLKGGDDAPQALRDDLSSSAVVLGMLTSASVSSSYVLMELGAAWMGKKKAIPLIGPGASFGSLPGPFKDIHALRMDHAPDMSGLIGTVAKATGFDETNNVPKVIASLQQLAEVVAASTYSAGGGGHAPPPAPAPTVGEAEALSLASTWLRGRAAKSVNLSYDDINNELPVTVARDVLRRVLSQAAQGTDWQVAAHEHSVALTYRMPGPVVMSTPRRGW